MKNVISSIGGGVGTRHGRGAASQRYAWTAATEAATTPTEAAKRAGTAATSQFPGRQQAPGQSAGNAEGGLMITAQPLGTKA